MKQSTLIKPFRIHVSDEDISALHRRLRHTRWPEPIAASNWEDGRR